MGYLMFLANAFFELRKSDNLSIIFINFMVALQFSNSFEVIFKNSKASATEELRDCTTNLTFIAFAFQ